MNKNTLLQIENATIFHHYKTILNDVNLNLSEGEFIYIIGKTGSGKSSLLRTIYSDIPLKMGTINFDNQNISQLSKSDLPFLRRKIGIIFQDFQLFQDRNAYENIKFVMESTGWKDQEKIDQKIKYLLETVGLENKSENYPYELSVYQLTKTENLLVMTSTDDVTTKKLNSWKKIGINRLSLGVQTFNDNLLKQLNRIHTSKDAIKSINKIKNIFNNYSIDLMFGTPNSSWRFNYNYISLSNNIECDRF